MITRAEIADNAATWALYSVPYAQDAYGDDGYRQDCSGFVSMCWGLPKSFNTVTLVDVMHEIEYADLRPGDAIGKCGPGTGGDDGHIQLFQSFSSWAGYVCLEQTPDDGPQRNVYSSVRWGYRCYRFNDVVEAPPPRPISKAVKMHLVRSGGGDGSVYVVGGAVEGGKLVAVGVHDPGILKSYADAGIVTVQLPNGVTVAGSGIYVCH